MDPNLNDVCRKKRSHSPPSCSSSNRRRSAEDESDKHKIRRHSYKSLDESDSEKIGITSRHFHQRSKYEKKKSRWEPLPTGIIKDYKKNNELFRPLTDMVDDRLKLAKEVINVVDDATFVEILPEFKKSSEKIRQEFVHEMLLFMSRKRIISILNGHIVSDSSSTDTPAEMSPSISVDSNSDEEQMFLNSRKYKSRTASSERTNSFDNISASSGSHHTSPYPKANHVNRGKSVRSRKLSSQQKDEEELEEGEIEDSDEGPVERISEDEESPEADNANGEVAEEELKSNRNKLPQQVPAVSTTTDAAEEEGESDEYPEDLDLELLE
ncbi:hypothetical protein Ddc_03970 [Ditylenchus destructor]|nr:hypothetical protein Ddc_03970 [Ditylenchus destructor]